jgi:ABC-2 type transport system ATP-binding protein
MNIIESRGLGRRYRRTWALRDCTLGIPGGHIVALVGPNGAGKTTLLTLAVGLNTPTEGGITVLGGEPAGSPDALDRIAFVAQDAPLYRNLPVTDMLHVARNLNRRWDQRHAEDRLADLDIPLRQKVGELSGGQKAQLALTIALARRPSLLVLDEPLAALDPVARDDFLASVVEAATDDGISVVLSSHVLAELERVATYLVVLTQGQVRVAATVRELLASHGAGLEEIALRHLRADSSASRTKGAA